MKKTLRAANNGDVASQNELGQLHFTSAFRLDMLYILQGASADDHAVAVRWADALKFLEMAAKQGFKLAQTQCALIFAAGDRSVPQNWTTAVKWWRLAARKAGIAGGGDEDSRGDMQWCIGLCNPSTKAGM
jgi:TPR repeat protein